MCWLKGNKICIQSHEVWYRLFHTQSTVTSETEPGQTQQNTEKKTELFLFPLPPTAQWNSQTFNNSKGFSTLLTWTCGGKIGLVVIHHRMTIMYYGTVLGTGTHYLLQSSPVFEMRTIIISGLEMRRWCKTSWKICPSSHSLVGGRYWTGPQAAEFQVLALPHSRRKALLFIKEIIFLLWIFVSVSESLLKAWFYFEFNPESSCVKDMKAV